MLYLTTREVADSVGLSYPAFWAWIGRGRVPQPKLRHGSNFAWSEEEAVNARRIVAELQARRRERRAARGKAVPT